METTPKGKSLLMHKITVPSSRTCDLLLPVVVLLLLSPLTFGFAGIRLAAFSQPAARLSSIFLGAPCNATAQGYRIECAALPVLVSLACSGTGFFVLLTAMLAGLLCRYRRLTPLTIATALVAAYAVTLLTNACRITLGWFASVWARHTLPESMWPGVHLSVGVLVFMSALVGVYVWVEWRLDHERNARDNQDPDR